MKTFLQSILNEKHFEKFVTGFIYSILGLVIAYMYVRKSFFDPNLGYIFGIAGTLFVTRKGLSYALNKDSYNQTSSTETTLTSDNTEQTETNQK